MPVFTSFESFLTHSKLIVVQDSIAQPSLALLGQFANTPSAHVTWVALLQRPTAAVTHDANIVDASSVYNPQIDLSDGPALVHRLLESKPRLLIIDSLSFLAARTSISSAVSMLKLLLNSTDAKVIVGIHSELDTFDGLSLSDILLKTPSFSSSLLRLTLHPTTLLKSLVHTYNLSIKTADSEEQDPRLFTFLHQFYKRGWAAQGFRRDESDEHETASVLDGLGNVHVGHCVIEYEARNMAGQQKPAALTAGPRQASIVKQAEPKANQTTWRGLIGLQRVKHGGFGLRGQLDLVDLDKILPKQHATPVQSQPAQHIGIDNLPFNLSLTEDQRRSKEGVLLPFLPAAGGKGGRIHYEADSNDDVDDEEADEDLEL